MKARVYVSLKAGIFDPQGSTIQQALNGLGFSGVSKVHAGKYFEIELDSSSQADAAQQLSKMCDQLLANPTIEQYRIEIE
ncbi:MAG TPA: phosphoribosylformylglycinamidine synthase subunit PurS [Nitrospiria bacterium]|nr:phosphoribosylformylglycinamidine synthase subunit PurS [Nitrospiria bacterium]